MASARFRVTFVRHGETYMNSKRLLQGHSDAALSEIGIQQATQLGRSISTTTFTKAYASDLQRAYNTAKIVLSQLTTTTPEIIKDYNLREKSFGEVEGRPVQEYLDLAAKANINIHEFVPKGGETTEELYKRTSVFFEVLCVLSKAAESHENVLVTSHGGWIQGLMKYLHSSSNKYVLKGFSASEAFRIHYNTGVTVISILPLNNTDGEGPEYEVNFLKINDGSHLTSQ